MVRPKHRITVFDKFFSDGSAGESGATGYKDFHSGQTFSID
jgi:hypothetical protein